MAPSDPLQLNEVGAYGDLSARPNPSGFVILTVPPFEQMLPFIAQRLGRELSPAEIEIERKKAPPLSSLKRTRSGWQQHELAEVEMTMPKSLQPLELVRSERKHCDRVVCVRKPPGSESFYVAA